MSVVAGCLLLDGVLLAADARITYSNAGGLKVYVDNAQKILAFGPATALGFVGNVRTASALIQSLMRARDRRPRLDPLSLKAWLPRFLRREFSRLRSEVRTDNIAFMVASSFEGRNSAIERATVARMLFKAGQQRGRLDDDLALRILQAPGNGPVLLRNTCASELYVLRPPSFAVASCPPFSFMAIGSGSGVTAAIDELQDMIFLNHRNHPGQEAAWLRRAMTGFVERNGIDTVGGLYPVLKIRGNSIFGIPQRTGRIAKGGAMMLDCDVELTIENGRWVQTNHTNGHRQPLFRPWELNDVEMKTRLFDYLDTRSLEAGDQLDASSA
jgi:hypothetical protein